MRPQKDALAPAGFSSPALSSWWRTVVSVLQDVGRVSVVGFGSSGGNATGGGLKPLSSGWSVWDSGEGERRRCARYGSCSRTGITKERLDIKLFFFFGNFIYKHVQQKCESHGDRERKQCQCIQTLYTAIGQTHHREM